MDLLVSVYKDEIDIGTLKKFKEEHKHSEDPTAIGGKFSYIVTPTSVGQAISIQCNDCGETADITEWSNF